MKKVLSLLCAVILLVSALAACSGDKNADGASDVDLSQVLADINERFDINDLKILENTDDLNRYYAIDGADVKQFAAELTTQASVYLEVIMVEAVDSDAAARVAVMLNNHLDTQLSTAKSYDADQVAAIENCKVTTNGNIAYLVISEDYDEIAGYIQSVL